MPICQPIPNTKRQRITALREQGLSKHDIAKATQCSVNTVDKYLCLDTPRLTNISTFKDNLSHLLHESLLSALHLQSNVLKSLNEDDIQFMSPGDKRQWARDMTTVSGILYDKIRLQDGKSTVNSSHRVQLESVHDNLFQPQYVGKTKKR